MTIYLDYQATTPLAPEALEAMLPWLTDQHANPHSSHAPGRRAAAAVEVAREEISALLPDGGRLVFTSGATEALNLALIGFAASRHPNGLYSDPSPCAPRSPRASVEQPERAVEADVERPLRIVSVATEHAAVLDTLGALAGQGCDVVLLPVLPDGLVDLAAARDAIRPGTDLVTAMLVNNEIGVIQPVAELADLAHAAGAVMLTDAVQGYGRVAIPPAVDLVAISAHKIYGPKGIGALWVRDGVALAPVQHGGGQEAGLRSGTLSPALCAGFGAAARLMRTRAAEDRAHVGQLWAEARTLFADWELNGSADARYHGNLNLRRAGIDAARLISDVRGVAFSAGSACASGSGRPSHVLAALGLSATGARASIRLGFGRSTTLEELREAARLIGLAAARQEAA